MRVLVLGLFLLALLGQTKASSTTPSNTPSNTTSNSTTTASPSAMSTNSMGGGANSMGGGVASNINYMVGMTTKSGQSHMLASASLLLASLGLHTLWQ